MTNRFEVENIGRGEDRIHKKTRWNLFNSAHKVPSDKYKENYDRIFRKGDENEEENSLA